MYNALLICALVEIMFPLWAVLSEAWPADKVCCDFFASRRSEGHWLWLVNTAPVCDWAGWSGTVLSASKGFPVHYVDTEMCALWGIACVWFEWSYMHCWKRSLNTCQISPPPSPQQTWLCLCSLSKLFTGMIDLIRVRRYSSQLLYSFMPGCFDFKLLHPEV